MITTIMLPFPPSDNGLYANRKGGRRISKAYGKWLDIASWELSQQPINNHKGLVYISISHMPPDRSRRDVLNYQKSICDLLVKGGVMDDDDQIIKGTVSWAYDKDQVGSVIEIVDAVGYPEWLEERVLKGRTNGQGN